MFYCFIVQEDHRDYLRFLWYEDNDLSKNVRDYQVKVHVFGNSPSPAVAVYCMRRATAEGEREHSSDAKQFLIRHFYVGDRLASAPTYKEATDILAKVQPETTKNSIQQP